jgi:hypothetical protein
MKAPDQESPSASAPDICTDEFWPPVRRCSAKEKIALIASNTLKTLNSDE